MDFLKLNFLSIKRNENLNVILNFLMFFYLPKQDLTKSRERK